QNDGQSTEASRFVVGHMGRLHDFSQSDVLGRSHHVAWLGHLPVERARLLLSSPVRPLHKPVPNRPGGARPYVVVWGNVRGLSSAHSTMVVGSICRQRDQLSNSGPSTRQPT